MDQQIHVSRIKLKKRKAKKNRDTKKNFLSTRDLPVRSHILVRSRRSCTMGDVSETVSALMYFAYGSNLLPRRFLINNKGTRMGTGKLMDYSLGFALPDDYWAGNVATIMPRKGAHVMGAIWEVTSDIRLLDEYVCNVFIL